MSTTKIPDETLLDHLREFADGLGHSPSSAEMNDEGPHSGVTYSRRFGSWSEALEAAGLEQNTHRSRVSREETRGAIQDLAEELGRTPTGKEFDQHGEYSKPLATKRFGSWNEALSEAGLDPVQRRYTPDQLREAIQELADELEKTPTRTELKQHKGIAQSAIDNHFGSWNGALRAAGFDPPHRKDIPTEELITALQSLAESQDETPTQGDMVDHGPFSSAVYKRRFGSWNEALGVAGITPTNHASIPDSVLLDSLRDLAVTLGRTPTVDDLAEHGEFSLLAYQGHFGTWNNALREIGHEPNNRWDIPREELLDELDAEVDRRGRPPTTLEIDDSGRFSVEPYRRAFGTFNQAVIEAGHTPVEWQDLSEEVVLGEIQRVADELNRPPTVEDMREWGAISAMVCYRLFGSFSTALEQLGLETWAERRREARIEGDLYGGIWPTQRERRREMDDHSCVSCPMDDEEHQRVYGRVLPVHRIRPAREFLTDGVVDEEAAHALANLRTLCIPCHSRWEGIPVGPHTG